MTKFLVTYHGGSPPADPDQAAQVRSAFGEWLAKVGDAVVDPGAPIRSAGQVANGNALPEVNIGGYTVIEARNVADAVEVLRSHPFVARGGTLQLHESVSV